MRETRFIGDSEMAAIDTHALRCACDALRALTDKEPEVSAGVSKACKGWAMVQHACQGLMPPAEQQCSAVLGCSKVDTL
jgi:hypothetical protein